MNKLCYLMTAIYGEILKLCCLFHLLTQNNGINKVEMRDRKIIVSLTSYGRRANRIVRFTICSLMRQTLKPDAIVLWLDRDKWNEDTIPRSLRSLTKYGLSIRYCSDNIRSYEKLVPALEAYPNDIIVTCDDDMWYSKRFLEDLYNSYLRNSEHVYTYGIKQIKRDNNGNMGKYNSWTMPTRQDRSAPSFALGYCGCLYRRDMLYNDVMRKDLFMKLCPTADDVWFFFMEFLAGTHCVLVKRKEPYPIDFFYQFFHKGSNLASVNCEEDLNDVQIKNIMNHYGISIDDLWKFCFKKV